MNLPHVVLLVMAISCACCQNRGEPASVEGEMSPESERVSVVGVARDAKLGAILETEHGLVWIDGLDSWPEDLLGRRVRAEGVSVVRDDLPVFVRREGEPEKSGMPVSSPEEVAAARRRTVLMGAGWELAPE